MNTIHRAVWNAALGSWIAAPETSRARSKTSRALSAPTAPTLARQGVLSSLGAVVVLSALSLHAWADGGAGGASYLGWAAGGAGGSASSPAGQDGASYSIDGYLPGGGGGGGAAHLSGGEAGNGAAGGAGGNGGAGGAGGVVGGYGDSSLQSVGISEAVAGGNASDGSVPSTSFRGYVDGGGGGGGGGGHGFAIYDNAQSATLTVQSTGSLTGGKGGNGASGHSTDEYGGGGGGGQGGGGVLITNSTATQVTVERGGVIQGGNGGNGGEGLAAYGGSGGDGGAGVMVVDSTGVQIHNAGTIAGGSGGAGGAAGTFGEGVDGADGAGGVGITGSNLTIINSGRISGGLSGDGATRANAIEFAGTTNSLELQAGYGITGNVAGSNESGATNTLILGGSTDSSFNSSLIGSQYLNFTDFSKTGASTWTLTGSTTEVTPWTISEGTLSVSDDASLGAVTGTLTLDGGTLQTTADISTSRAITLGSSGGTVSTATGAILTWSGVVSGAGSLTKNGDGTLTLTGTNTYGGGTAVNAGSLVAGSAGAFVQNTAYAVNGGTLDLGSWDLTASSFSGTGGSVALNAQTLTVEQSRNTSYAGSISGTGSLVKSGSGTLGLSGNSTYSGGTRLLAGRIDVGSNTALGTGELDMADGTALGFAANNLVIGNAIVLSGVGDPTIDTGSYDETLTGDISGTGELTKEGSGTLTLTGSSTYSGDTTVAEGTLKAGAANVFSRASAYSVASGATLDTGGYNQSIGALTNSGTVSLAGNSAGSTLTVNGNYAGNNGLLRIGTVLGDSSSASDQLVITGSASGSTSVRVTNLGGLGALTTGDGIRIISAAGGIASGAFSLAGTVSAGAYDYHLNTTSNAAYLSSTTTVTTTTSKGPTTTTVPTYRAEASLYSALPEQLRQANLAMLGSLHQRVGDDGGTGANTASPGQGWRQAWGRVIGIDRDISQSGTVSPTSSGRLTGFQAGTDLWANPNWRAGVYVGQLDGDMDVSGFARGVANYAAGTNTLRNQYLGGYATWKNDAGLYLDGVLQAGRHRDAVSPNEGQRSAGNGDSLLASIEVGQAFNIAPNWIVEPQLQLVHQRISLDDSYIEGAVVQQDSGNGWMARAGVRVKGEIQTGAGTVEPYARLNVYKSSSGTDTTTFIGPAASTAILTRTDGTSSEMAAGATWQVSQSTSLYGEIGERWASGGDARTKSRVNGSVGVKVRW